MITGHNRVSIRAFRARKAAFITIAVLTCAFCYPAAGQVRGQVRGGSVEAPGPTTQPDSNKPLPLVNADDELAGYLVKARDLLQQEKPAYDRAIAILQALILRRDAPFIATEDGRRYVSMWLKANEMIGSMKPGGLKLYRALYDPQAKRLYDKALATGDRMLLRQVVRRYLHTNYGPAALERLGTISFDRAQFYRAGRYWRQLLRTNPPKPRRALILAKMAVAYHLAGEMGESDKIEATLKRNYPGARAKIADTQRDLVSFVAEIRSRPAMTTRRVAVLRGWPGLGALPGGIGAMDDCDVVLVPRWRRPNVDLEGDLKSRLIAPLGQLGMSLNRSTNRYLLNRNPQATVSMRGGHVRMSISQSSRRREITVPGMIHPVVVGDVVIFRRSDYVVACDLLTGETQWRSLPLPLYRKWQPTSVRNYGWSNFPTSVADRSRYGMTVGGGLLYVLYDFRPDIPNIQYVMRLNPNASKTLADTSGLAALSLEAQGRVQWQVGNGQGDDEILRNGKFLSPPAYYGDRLFVMAMYMEGYYLLCLDSQTGSLIWKSAIAQTPTVSRRYGYAQIPMIDRGSPPVVMDGRVFVTTNAGVIAALDVGTGQSLWAYQYDSDLAAAPGRRTVVRRSRDFNPLANPPNPVMASRGLIISMPADSAKVIALNAENGSPVWLADRQGMSDMSPIDETRLALSGPGVVVLSAFDGRVLASPDQVKGVSGRPAVTRSELLLSAEGKVYRLNLSDYSLGSMDLARHDGLLGNLLSVDGKLIASNAAGISAYFSYDEAYDRLTERFEAADGAEARSDVMLQRAQLAFNAERFKSALKDIDTCARIAPQRSDAAAFRRRLQPWYHRTCIALGNAAGNLAEMRRMFEKAISYAETDQEKAHMLLRMAKFYELQAEQSRDGDRLAAAQASAAKAQELAETYPTEQIVDVVIGSRADSSVRFDSGRQTRQASQLAQLFIRKLIEIYGQEAYAAFDAKAKAALDKARSEDDPEGMLKVPRLWPNSRWADDARFAAAESFYRRALAAGGKEAEEPMSKAIQHLSILEFEERSPLRPSAQFALAMLYGRSGQTILVTVKCAELDKLPPETPIRFAEIRGTLGELLKKVRKGDMGKITSVAIRHVSRIETPLTKIYSIDDKETYILRDQEFRPVRLGQSIFVLRGDRVLMLDTSAGNEKSAIVWSGLSGVDKAMLQRYAFPVPGMTLIGALSTDQKALIVADRVSMSAFDLISGKVLWRRKFKDMGIGRFTSMSVGFDVIIVSDTAGKIVCTEISSGKVRWVSVLAGTLSQRRLNGPPRIGKSLVMVRSNGFRILTCLDTRTGKIVRKVTAGTYVDGRMTPQGLLLMMVDGKLSAFDPADLNKPIWTRTYNTAKRPAILAIGDRRVVVSGEFSSPDIEIVSITSGQVIAKLKLANAGGSRRYPVDAWIKGESLYVIGSIKPDQYRGRAYGRLSNCYGLNIQKFNLSGKVLEWNTTLDTDQTAVYQTIPAAIGKRHIVIFARPVRSDMPSKAVVLDTSNGAVRQRIDIKGNSAGRNTRGRKLGSPVMTNGRLVVETAGGLEIYGGQ